MLRKTGVIIETVTIATITAKKTDIPPASHFYKVPWSPGVVHTFTPGQLACT